MDIDATKEWDGIQENLESRLAERNAGNIFVSPYLLRLVEAELQELRESLTIARRTSVSGMVTKRILRNQQAILMLMSTPKEKLQDVCHKTQDVLELMDA